MENEEVNGKNNGTKKNCSNELVIIHCRNEMEKSKQQKQYNQFQSFDQCKLIYF